MQLTRLPLPVGTTDFKRICRENYYVDKTLLIKDLLDEKVSNILFTRPRRFGKTLNMDMLRTFFEKTDADTSSYFKDKKHVQHASLVLCVLIILSTMFIKQHSVFDVSTAFMLAFVMYNVVYIKNWMHLPQKSGSFQDAANSKVRV